MSRIKYLNETKKNVIITGIPRAGKSTVALKICKQLNYNLIQLDSIVEAMKKAFPEFKTEKKADGILEVNSFTPFLMEYLKELNDDVPRKRGINYVIEGSDLDINEYLNFFSKDDFILIGIVYSERTIDEIYKTMKDNDTILDWSYYLNDTELREYSHALYLRNKQFEKLFKKHGIRYYDVSHNRDRVLEQIKTDLVTIIKI